MTRDALCDTSFLVALLDNKDIHHVRAHEIQREKSSAVRLLVVDFVVAESAGVLKRRIVERGHRDDLPNALRVLQGKWVRGGRLTLGEDYPSVMGGAFDRIHRAPFEMNLTDAMVVEAALLFGAEELISFDKHFDGVPGLTRVG